MPCWPNLASNAMLASSSTIGARCWAVTGRGVTPTRSRASPIWRRWCSQSPGTISVEEREFYRSLPNQTEVSVRGLHFIQEDSPDEIGEALAKWYTSLQE